MHLLQIPGGLRRGNRKSVSLSSDLWKAESTRWWKVSVQTGREGPPQEEWRGKRCWTQNKQPGCAQSAEKIVPYMTRGKRQTEKSSVGGDVQSVGHSLRQRKHLRDFSPEKIKKIFENPIYRGQASKYLRKWGWVEIPTPFFLLPGSVAKNGPS